MNRLPVKNSNRAHDSAYRLLTLRSKIARRHVLVSVSLVLFSVGCSKSKVEVAAKTGKEQSVESKSSDSSDSENKPINTKTNSSKELLDEIRDGISMIKDEPDAFLSKGFLHPILRMRLQVASNRTSSPGALTEYEFNNLQWHLESSLNAEFKLNADKSVAVAHYELSESDKPVAPASKSNPFEDQKPSKPSPGLGDDLKTVLTKAAALVENGKLEEFVMSVYPVTDVARFEDPEEMQQHLERIQDEAMKTAMVRDLRAAAAATPQVQGNLATVSLAGIVDGDPVRQFKFEKVDGHWRFIDSDKEERLELVNFVSQQSAKPQGKPTQGVIVFTRTESGWKIMTMPTTE